MSPRLAQATAPRDKRRLAEAAVLLFLLSWWSEMRSELSDWREVLSERRRMGLAAASLWSSKVGPAKVFSQQDRAHPAAAAVWRR
eukprot:CAMPEP_0119106014 /NCGR_PEP_ID=MMETSP1180-20130426/3827_1 /TAXON_ID=3052 ORGANISM="Chlamydomonas cf sp, Strain CCMP681" /NCGR_SAMPLE_ID=MMETSP1180 /ASSEMBLY_ACC=CAM_ASM_000741 /LENGTH=84 /DNA_ID=CAMNT_0007091231 /DNA_START=381 /DNA_END=635 /DNA_ORIENTATION=-